MIPRCREPIAPEPEVDALRETGQVDETDELELSEEELQRLRALGYVR